ncbi:MAG: glycosyltransferase family 4 protein [Planctomycetota bacterium]|jgi:glycosyltransferase involved in cell wall biosynthesis
MRSPRVGIDFHVAGGIFQGVRTYLANLIEQLLRLENEFTYFIYTETPGNFSHWQNNHSKIVMKRLPSASGYFNLFAGFPACAMRDGLSLFHSQYVLPVYVPCKSILTIHDILFESHPEFFPPFHRMLMKFFVPYSAKRADRIISVSEFTKSEIFKHYGIPDEKVTVTYEGAATTFLPLKEKALILSRLKKHGIRTKYMLFVGRIEPRKNISGILKAMEYLKRRGHKDLCLVVVGDQDKIFKERTLFAQIEGRGLQSDVVFTGGVSEEDLCILYNGAEVLVYPAFAEGFGLPVVEAMACGTPVITGNTTALEEVAGDAAILVNPHAVEEIAQAIERVWVDDALKGSLSRKGLDQSKRFQWKKTAQETIEVYRQGVRSQHSTE